MKITQFRKRKKEALEILDFLNKNLVTISVTEPGRGSNGVKLHAGRRLITYEFREKFPDAKTSRRFGGVILFHEFKFETDGFHWALKNEWFDRMWNDLSYLIKMSRIKKEY